MNLDVIAYDFLNPSYQVWRSDNNEPGTITCSVPSQYVAEIRREQIAHDYVFPDNDEDRSPVGCIVESATDGLHT